MANPYTKDEQTDRGKELEAAIKEYLDKRSEKPEFYYHRFPDARSGGGRIGKQPADFIIWQKGKADVLIDPKELSVKKGKSPLLNFKSRCSQVPKMTRMNMAGVYAYFLAYRTDNEKYYVLSRTYISSLKDKGKKSVNLDKEPEVDTLVEAMEQILGGL